VTTLLVGTGGLARAADDPPPLRVHVANDVSPAALAEVRRMASLSVSMCRAQQGLPEAPPPALPDSQLQKLSFVETTTYFAGDLIASYTTQRFIRADAQSRCEPFVWVQREARAVLGCDTRLTGFGIGAPPAVLPGPALPGGRPKVESHPLASRNCPNPYKPLSSAGVPVADAGHGVGCLWSSARIWAQLDARQRVLAPNLDPGSTGSSPSPRRPDQCLYERRPDHRSAHSVGEPVMVAGHAPSTDPGGVIDIEARLHFQRNFHLVELVEGTPIPPAMFTLVAIESFVQRPWREALADTR
jgi:hypothetical protein